ncbi:MAG: HD-GYP domain-containing protein [Chloroflexota bacterium]|nr:MAG: HD-GYP domain-containing protein [Chloroflexota bacterium]
MAERRTTGMGTAWTPPGLGTSPLDVRAPEDNRSAWATNHDPARDDSSSRTGSSAVARRIAHGLRDLFGRQDPRTPWPLRVTVAALGVAYVLAWIVFLPSVAQSNLWGLILFAILAIAAEHYGVSLYGDSRVSISFVFSMASVILFHSSGALVVGSLLALSVGIARRHALHKIVFNLGSIVLAALAGSLTYHSFGIALEPSNLPYLLLAALAASVMNYLVSGWLVALVVALTAHKPATDIWREKFKWLFFHYVVLGILSLLLSVAFESLGLFGLLAFLAPPLMMRYAMKQYVDRTVENVTALQNANEELHVKHEEITRAFHDLHETYDATLLALSAALDSRDSETEGHSQRVVAYSRLIARALDLPEVEILNLAQGALLHDVGKIGIPDSILLKPGPLSEEEWAEMRRHPMLGMRILSNVRFLCGALPVVKHHHERWDGSGYPEGLRGDQIPLGARIFAVADAFDAMTANRPYRKALPCWYAREEIRRCAGTHFDPKVVSAFLSIPLSALQELAVQAGVGG